MAISDKELDELVELEKKATPGPWNATYGTYSDPGYYSADFAKGPDHKMGNDSVHLAKQDATFIATFRNTAKGLLEEVKELRAENREAREVLEFYANGKHIKSGFDENDPDWTKNAPDIIEDGERARDLLDEWQKEGV